jgi:hypothetical protein
MTPPHEWRPSKIFQGRFWQQEQWNTKSKGIKRKNHKNLLKKPQNVRGVNTLLTFWGHHIG